MTLYRYFNKGVIKHTTHGDCTVMVVHETPFGTLYRCRHMSNDFYGYRMMKEAKDEEIQATVERVSDEQQWLKKLRGTKKNKRS